MPILFLEVREKISSFESTFFPIFFYFYSKNVSQINKDIDIQNPQHCEQFPLETPFFKFKFIEIYKSPNLCIKRELASNLTLCYSFFHSLLLMANHNKKALSLSQLNGSKYSLPLMELLSMPRLP